MTTGSEEDGAVSQEVCVQWSNQSSWSHHVRFCHVYALCRLLKSDDQSFTLAARLSLARSPETWSVVSLPLLKSGLLHGLLQVPENRERTGRWNS